MNQKRLYMKCRKLVKAAGKLARMLENLQKTVGTKGEIPKDKMESCKLEIGQTQEMLQEAPKAHDKAIAKLYELLRNHTREPLSETVLSCISSQSSVLTQPKGSGSTYSRWCASPRGPLCNSISCK